MTTSHLCCLKLRPEVPGALLAAEKPIAGRAPLPLGALAIRRGLRKIEGMQISISWGSSDDDIPEELLHSALTEWFEADCPDVFEYDGIKLKLLAKRGAKKRQKDPHRTLNADYFPRVPHKYQAQVGGCPRACLHILAALKNGTELPNFRQPEKRCWAVCDKCVRESYKLTEATTRKAEEESPLFKEK